MALHPREKKGKTSFHDKKMDTWKPMKNPFSPLV